MRVAAIVHAVLGRDGQQDLLGFRQRVIAAIDDSKSAQPQIAIHGDVADVDRRIVRKLRRQGRSQEPLFDSGLADQAGVDVEEILIQNASVLDDPNDTLVLLQYERPALVFRDKTGRIVESSTTRRIEAERLTGLDPPEAQVLERKVAIDSSPIAEATAAFCMAGYHPLALASAMQIAHQPTAAEATGEVEGSRPILGCPDILAACS
jgi:hypothetical protein